MISQFGALPYRRDEAGGLRILLVTSRDTGRWVVPKGNPMPRLAGWEAAAREAFEEAGVEGRIERTPIGSFRYRKRRRLMLPVYAEVTLFPLCVERELDQWLEEHQRRRRWFAQEEAAVAVAERKLKRLILDFRP